jgi:hypothetical protein
MRDDPTNPALFDSWNDAMKGQRQDKAAESQSIDLTLLASTPMHDRLTFECAQAVEEKMTERVRKGGSGSGGSQGRMYQGWMAEIERQVMHHERGAEKQQPPQPLSRSRSSSSVPKKRSRPPSDRCVIGHLSYRLFLDFL